MLVWPQVQWVIRRCGSVVASPPPRVVVNDTDDQANAGRQNATSTLRYRRYGDVDNELEPAVARHHPAIGRLVRALIRAGATHAAMSGSGSAVFGLFRTRASASAGAQAIGRSAPTVLVTRTIDRQAYQRLACK